MALAMAGCAGAVDVDSPELDRDEAAACDAFLDALPEELAGEEVREVDPASAPAAAWGDPAIVVTCGGSMPASFDEFSACEEINGVGWYVPQQQIADSTRALDLHTIGRTPVVRLQVPAEYRPPNDVLATLAEPVKEHLRLDKPCV